MSDTQNVPSTRKESVESGNKFFFTGRPCKQGHTALRYTTSGVCVECISENSKKLLARFREAKARVKAEAEAEAKTEVWAKAKAEALSVAQRKTQISQESRG